MPKYYRTLPTTDAEVIDLMKQHGYLEDRFLLDTGLSLDQIALLNGSLVLNDQRHSIKFTTYTSKEMKEIFDETEDEYDRHYDLLIAEVTLLLKARHRSLRDGSIMRQSIQPIMLPIAVTADIAPDRIMHSIYSSLKEMNVNDSFNIIY